jgi:hypothetical protein
MKNRWTLILSGLLVALFLAASVVPVEAQGRRRKKKSKPTVKSKKDVVIYSKGEIQGTIKLESWQEIVIDVGRGRTQKIDADDIILVIYRDAPDAYRGAMERIGANDYGSALISLGSAKEWVDDPKNKRKKPGPWFHAYYTYYRGLCLSRQKKHKFAVSAFSDYLTRYAARYHMTRRALAVCFDSLKASKDTNKAKEIRSIPLPAALKPFTDLKTAEFLLASDDASGAKDICQQGRLSGDPKLVNQFLILLVRCLKALNDQEGLKDLCQEIINTSQDRSALFIAKAGLGEMEYRKKNLKRAVELLTEAIVLHHAPNLGEAHENAVWTLANAYEKLADKTEDIKAKKRFLFMASGAYYELTAHHRKGKHTADAQSRAEKLDKKMADLEGGDPGGGKD